jgi:hypothetical protein
MYLVLITPLTKKWKIHGLGGCQTTSNTYGIHGGIKAATAASDLTISPPMIATCGINMIKPSMKTYSKSANNDDALCTK